MASRTHVHTHTHTHSTSWKFAAPLSCPAGSQGWGASTRGYTSPSLPWPPPFTSGYPHSLTEHLTSSRWSQTQETCMTKLQGTELWIQALHVLFIPWNSLCSSTSPVPVFEEYCQRQLLNFLPNLSNSPFLSEKLLPSRILLPWASRFPPRDILKH